jgi:hypothetical protein
LPAEATAEVEAEKAYDETFNKAYPAEYTKAFNDAFALAVASHEGRTYYDYENGGIKRIRVDGPDAENVVPLKARRSYPGMKGAKAVLEARNSAALETGA